MKKLVLLLILLNLYCASEKQRCLEDMKDLEQFTLYYPLGPCVSGYGPKNPNRPFESPLDEDARISCLLVILQKENCKRLSSKPFIIDKLEEISNVK